MHKVKTSTAAVDIVRIGVLTTPSKTSPPYFLPRPALNWQTVQAPPF